MISFFNSTDATTTYRETSALSTIRMDGTADTGSLIEVMRDAVLVLGLPGENPNDRKIPSQRGDDLEAIVGN